MITDVCRNMASLTSSICCIGLFLPESRYLQLMLKTRPTNVPQKGQTYGFYTNLKTYGRQGSNDISAYNPCCRIACGERWLTFAIRQRAY